MRNHSRHGLALALVVVAGLIGVVAPVGAAEKKFKVTEFSVGLTPDVSLEGITAGPDGNLWFTELDGRVGRITPDGVITEFTAGITRGSQDTQLSGITAGPEGNVWYTSTVNNGEGDERGRIGKVTPDGAIVEFSAGITGKPSHITAGADGNLWFTELTVLSEALIGRITPAGVVTEFPIGPTKFSGDSGGIAAGPDGNVWYTKVGQNFVGRITPAGVITEFAVDSDPKVGTFALTAGSDGALWFTMDYLKEVENTTDPVGRITPNGKITTFSDAPSADDVTTGCDGNVWFDVGGDAIWRMTPKGKITKIRTGFTGYPGASTAGPDGNLWVTEGSSGAGARIARIETPVAKSKGRNLTLPAACPDARDKDGS